MDKDKISELDAALRLAEIMNDSERTIKLGKRKFKIRALRAGTQWLVAQEACKIAKAAETYADIIKQFAANLPSVIRVICLVILNDKEKIESDEYQALYDYIQWEVPQREWIGVLFESLQMLDYDSFFKLCGAIDSFRTLMIKKTQR